MLLEGEGERHRAREWGRERERGKERDELPVYPSVGLIQTQQPLRVKVELLTWWPVAQCENWLAALSSSALRLQASPFFLCVCTFACICSFNIYVCVFIYRNASNFTQFSHREAAVCHICVYRCDAVVSVCDCHISVFSSSLYLFRFSSLQFFIVSPHVHINTTPTYQLFKGEQNNSSSFLTLKLWQN